ncbi:unnamed protein product [Spodoptera littoralis]|uniref:Uncharacterized protein n=1 Tax=Spodoptera littoralis TaxID=7109 RepID=A0A9P0HX58_SPOLI|nr:unnamed protein product [Spodoptera littoralis]CAH1635607.1 unnamed protein product [Spodoptera littoralis]
MTKCDICNKGITSRSPGLECQSCAKTVHASKACSGLTAKQLSALRNADGLDWICEECNRNSPNRKSSFFVPEEEDDEEEVENPSNTVGNIDSEKFLKDIIAELKKVLKKELQPIEISVGLCSKRVEELTKTVEAQNKHIQELERKYTHLKNEKTHLELEVSSLKQHVRSIEQQRLDNVIEVTGVPKTENEDLDGIGSKLAETLNVDKSHILNIKRLEGRNERDGNIQLEMKQVEYAQSWVRACKKEEVRLEQIIPAATVEVSKSKIILRRALTKANKSLLWLAQQKLKPAYKYVWFQDGKVLLRKEDKDKPIVIRCETDIIRLLSTTQTGNKCTYR